MKREELVVKPYTLCYEGCYHKTEADSVMDAMEAKIKELEHKLYGSSGQSTHLLNRINNFRSTDPKATDLIEDCYKCIHQQMATISKMETTQKWISVKDRLPEENIPVVIRYKNDIGLLVACRKVDPIFDYAWFSDFGMDVKENVTHWMPLPSAPTTEEK